MAEAQRLVIDNFLGGLAPSIYVGNPQTQSDPDHTSGWEIFSPSEDGLLQRGYPSKYVTNASLIQGTLHWMKNYNRTAGAYTFILGTDDNLIKNRLYQVNLSSDTLTNSTLFPHTISDSNGAIQGGTGTEFYGGYLYYASGRYLGRYDMSLTFNDSFSIYLGTQALGDYIDHPMVQGGGKLFIGNSNFSLNTPSIATVDSNGAVNLAALDLSQTEQVIKALEYSRNFLYIATTNNTAANTNTSDSYLYVWDGISGSWQEQFRFPEENFTAIKFANGQLFCWGNKGFYRFTGSGFELIYPIQGGPSAGGVSVRPNGVVYFRDGAGSIYGYGTDNPQIPPVVYTPYTGGSAVYNGAVHWASRSKLFASANASPRLYEYFSGGTNDYVSASWRTPMINFGQLTRLVRVYMVFQSWPTGATMDVKWATGSGSSTTTIGTVSTAGETTAEFYPEGCVADFWQVGLTLTAAPGGITPKIQRIVIDYQPEKE